MYSNNKNIGCQRRILNCWTVRQSTLASQRLAGAPPLTGEPRGNFPQCPSYKSGTGCQGRVMGFVGGGGGNNAIAIALPPLSFVYCIVNIK